MSYTSLFKWLKKYQWLIIFIFSAKIPFVGIYLFSSGFLLTRNELPNKSSPNTFPLGNHLDTLFFHNHNSSQQYSESDNKLKENASVSQIWPTQKYEKVTILIIDALRIDYAAFNYSNSKGKFTYTSKDSIGKYILDSPQLNFRDKIPIIDLKLSKNPLQSMLLRFRADPPTTTLQRLKGLTTGQLPTFIDAGSNFAGSSISEDNWLYQFSNSFTARNLNSNQTSRNLVFLGDDTWSSLFPVQLENTFPPSALKGSTPSDGWTFSRPFPSLDVWDLDTVDDGVISFLPFFLLPNFSELSHNETPGHNQIFYNKWSSLIFSNRSSQNSNHYSQINSDSGFPPDPQNFNLIIGHLLGVDHAGHRYGPVHKEMSRKLSQMNSLISLTIDSMDLDLKRQKSSHPNSKNYNSSLLIVFGDHGMNMKGDHGGDSDEELDAGIFMYSNIPFKSESGQKRVYRVLERTKDFLQNLSIQNNIETDHDIRDGFAHNGHLYNGNPIRNMLQVDFVPTISLMLGLPIPFNNLGSVNGELFCDSFYKIPNLNETVIRSANITFFSKKSKSIDFKSFIHNHAIPNLLIKNSGPVLEWGYLYSMRLNAAQIYLYLSTYKTFSSNHGFSKDMLSNWDILYNKAQLSYLDLLHFRNSFNDTKFIDEKDKYNLESLEEKSTIDFLVFSRVVLSDLRKSWAQFDNTLIYFGLLFTSIGFIQLIYIAFLINDIGISPICNIAFKSLISGVAFNFLSTRMIKFFSIIFQAISGSSVFLELSEKFQKNPKAGLGISASLSSLTFLTLSILYKKVKPLNHQTGKIVNDEKSGGDVTRSRYKLSILNLLSVAGIIITLLHSLIFTSNSFTINEESVVFYLLQTYFLLLLLFGLWNIKSFIFQKKEVRDYFVSVFCIANVISLNKISTISSVCREETSSFCNTTFYGFGQSPSLTVSTVSLSIFGMILSYITPLLLKALVFKGSYKDIYSTNIWTSLGLSSTLTLSSFYWLIDSIQGNLSNVLGSEKDGLDWSD
ncbi:GPI ethanolamine phosphate transferase 3 [Smittium mucronatum]|uniref:GPI ethanolamine phosphate transferase 3 n=1 Tax=Smittium mucronatum TaxID=133383 RepID=A0A1R0GL51_9FUNG|nr:GPI ethanolamine phosphate transferase 3 [Smittium mucronatum]